MQLVRRCDRVFVFCRNFSKSRISSSALANLSSTVLGTREIVPLPFAPSNMPSIRRRWHSASEALRLDNSSSSMTRTVKCLLLSSRP
eukprot:scaffold9832_cov156-Skeletonema_dohrnii-CCMP3373.AAC.1